MDYNGQELIDIYIYIYIYIGIFKYTAIAVYCLTRLRNQ